MGYRVNEKRTLLVGNQKVAGGRTIPSALAKEIGKEGIESLLKDGAIHEKKEKKPVEKKEVEIQTDELENLTRDELFQKAEELDIELPTRSSKADMIYAIREAQ